MSRYEIAGRKPDVKVVVGWDPPLRTYFAQVYDASLEEEDGGRPRQFCGILDLKRAVDQHAELTLDLLATLVDDRWRDP